MILITAILSTILHAGECSVDAKKFKPLLSKESVEMDGPPKIEIKDNRHIETVRLQKGMILEIRQVGCKDYSIIYRFDSVPDTTPVFNYRYYVSKMAGYLAKRLGPGGVPLDKGVSDFLKKNSGAIALSPPPNPEKTAWGKVNDQVAELHYPFGGAQILLRVQRVNEKVVSLELTYQLPLPL